MDKLDKEATLLMFKLPDTISEAEVLLLIKSSKKNKLKTAIALGFYQGMRVSEVINLTKADVDIQRGFIHVKQGKGNKDRDVPLMKPVIFYIRFLPVNVTRQALHKAIKKLGKEVLKKDLHFHTLRHSGASFYLNEKGIDIRHIQELLGHSRLSTTQIYTHVNPQQLKNAFNEAWR